MNGDVCAHAQEFCDAVVALLTDDARRIAMGERAQTYVRREHGADILNAYVRCLVTRD